MSSMSTTMHAFVSGALLQTQAPSLRARTRARACPASSSSSSPLSVRTTTHSACTLHRASPPGVHARVESAVPPPVPASAPADADSDASFLYALLGLAVAAMPALPAAHAAEVPPALKDAFTSIPVSLGHPATMWLLLGTSLYAFYLGWQSRQIRSVNAERRKELVKSKVTQRHFKTASALFTIMTIATFSGMANTYARTGKLFPGPHLYAGLGLVAVMSVMSAMVPYMQQGKDWAKNVHFSLAFGAVALFGWQAKTGMIIVGKLLHWD